MKRFALISAAVGCIALSGCVLHDHRHSRPHVSKVVVPVPVVVVPAKAAKNCPPGQAKKGNC